MANTAFRRCLIAVLGLVISLGSPAHGRAATIRLALDKGQTFTWEWKIVRSTEAEGKPKQSGESSTPVTLRVLDRTREGYMLEIQNGRTIFDPSLQQAMKDQAALAELQTFAETFKIRFSVTKDGEIGDIVNFDDIKAAYRKIADKAPAANAADRAAGGGFFEQITASKEVLAALALNHVNLLFYGTNIDPQMKQPVDFKTELPNPFGGQPIKATGKLTLKGVDGKNKTAECRVEQVADMHSFVQMMKDLGAKVGKEPPKEVLEKMMSGSIRDSISAIVNVDTGLTTHAKQVRNSVLPGVVKIDQVEITLQK